MHGFESSVPDDSEPQYSAGSERQNVNLLTVTKPIDMELIDPKSGLATPIEAELYYDPRDPYAVTTVFMTGKSQVRWTFGRDLLVEGLEEAQGDGDVHVYPCLDEDGRPVVIVELNSPEGEALVQARTDEVEAFVDCMLETVPVGKEGEQLDVDAAMRAILEDGV